jgi:hypothetical protein
VIPPMSSAGSVPKTRLRGSQRLVWERFDRIGHALSSRRRLGAAGSLRTLGQARVQEPGPVQGPIA